MTADLENRIKQIEQRNSDVEANKKWETSLVRRLSIASITYCTVVAYSYIIGASDIFLVSLIPVIGFIFSTLSLQIIRSKFEKGENPK